MTSILLTGTLLLTDKAAIDAEVARGNTGGALVVVVVGSVDGDTPRAYATRLFNRWQLDSRNRNKGVLLFAALVDRKVEIVVGDGFVANVTTTSKMVRLTELDDDAHLKSGEITEEQLGSANYDIWMCNQCQDIIKERYGAFFTSYSRCGACNYKTVKRTSQTLSAATHYSSGLAEVTEDCLHCGNHQTFTRTIPRLSQSSSSSFHSSGSGSSGSRGGSSSGRGSSGSW